MSRKQGLRNRKQKQYALMIGLALMIELISAAAWQKNAGATVPNTQARARGCQNGVNPLDKIKPSWVSVEPGDTPQDAEGWVRKSKVSHTDNPAYHTSHDWNFDVKLDQPYADRLNSNANDIENGEQMMEMEWEIRYFDSRFWPVAGDKVWMRGRWIFDCGHPGGGYRTEIHPPKAVAFTRLEPTIFAGDRAPSLTNKTYIYIHGKGGYYKTPVAQENYEFDIPLPNKPSETAQLRAEVLDSPFGGPSPILTPEPGDNPTKVHVVYPLKDINDPSPDRKYGAVIGVGWREPTLSQGYRKLRVTFDSIKINQDHDPFASGEWRFWVRAGSNWIEVPGLSDVDNGDVVKISKSVELLVPENGNVSIETTGWEDDCDGRFRKSDGDIKLWSVSSADLQCKIDDNDTLGYLSQTYTAAKNFGIGSHNAGSVRNGSKDTQNDFQLRYHIEEVANFAPGMTVSDQINPQPNPEQATDIQQKYAQLIRDNPWIGKPTIPESVCPDGVGRYQHYEGNASIYWSPQTGAHLIYGLIRAKWGKGRNAVTQCKVAETLV